METMFPTFRRLLATSWSDFTFAWPWFTTRAQSQALLRLLATAVEENLPLAPLLERWGADERGIQKWRVLRLGRLLAAGRPLADAVEEVPQALGEQYILAVRFDANMGTRTAAMRQALAAASAPQNRRSPTLKKTLVYSAAVGLFALLMIAWSQFKLVPIFRKILMEFSIPEPPAMVFFRQGWEVFAAYLLPAVIAGLAIIWLLFVSRRGAEFRRSLFSHLFSRWGEGISAEVLENLGIAAQAGRPLGGALSLLARYHYDPLTRQRLLFARNEVEQGMDVWHSLTSVGLLAPPEMKLLATAERLDNRPWVLAQLAEVRQLRAQRRREWAGTFLLPVLVMGMGLVVLFQALTVFLPLTEIIYRL